MMDIIKTQEVVFEYIRRDEEGNGSRQFRHIPGTVHRHSGS